MGYHLAHNLPGLSVSHLENEGLITLEERKVIPNGNEMLLRESTKSPQAFSVALRSIIEKI